MYSIGKINTSELFETEAEFRNTNCTYTQRVVTDTYTPLANSTNIMQ